MAFDRVDWHWDSASALYCRKHGISSDDLTQAQIREIDLYAANHIGLFLRWLIENDLVGKGADRKCCEKVRNGQMSGAEYLLDCCDGKFWDADVKKDALAFVRFYYGENAYLDDYTQCCTNETDKPVYGVLTGENDYLLLKQNIDRAFMLFKALGL